MTPIRRISPVDCASKVADTRRRARAEERIHLTGLNGSPPLAPPPPGGDAIRVACRSRD
jgi:hypothetical protein